MAESSGLVKKLCEVMAVVQRIPKRGRNEFHKYDYATEADIVEAVRGELSTRNIFIFSDCETHNRSGDFTDIMVAWTFVDGDTGESRTCHVPGSGNDKGDKGVYKALTGSLKYFLMKSFLMPTGDDPEGDSKTDAYAEGKNGSVEAAQEVAARKINEQMAKVEDFVNKNKPKVNLPPVNQPSRIEQVLKESIKNAEERDAYAVSGMLMKTEKKQGPKAKYMKVVIEAPGKKEIKLNLFDNHTFQDKTKLWDLLEMASSRFVSFLVKQDPDPKFPPTIIRVLKIHNIEFGEDKEPRRMAKTPEPLPPIESSAIDEYVL